MVRALKFHERKLLKKVDFYNYKSDPSLRENAVLRTYHIQRREDYIKYNLLAGQVRKIANRLSMLDPKDPFRDKTTDALLDKLYRMGLITAAKSLSQCEKMTVSAFCRRRLPVVMVRLKMAETVKQAVIYVEQGHIRVGPQTVTDPAYLVSRNMEDFITWVDSSKIKHKIMKYNDKLDDFDLL
ncbi:U3 small nucleolar ribonucleoprotein imp3 [Polyrhizophydium stewartii]|uniref:U3 small nucleolar ribonucleoprotein imp3 n=1 Tax=Polyrhizophydium stewartii TaxID=2732419 RepID=A0ABR4MV82_9FUNG|nr:Small subunit (SSU) processome component [Polyrhizophydium stewartii]